MDLNKKESDLMVAREREACQKREEALKVEVVVSQQKALAMAASLKDKESLVNSQEQEIIRLNGKIQLLEEEKKNFGKILDYELQLKTNEFKKVIHDLKNEMDHAQSLHDDELRHVLSNYELVLPFF